MAGDRKVLRYGAYAAGVAALIVLAMGAMRMVAGGDGVPLLGLGVGALNLALLLRVVRWEVNE